MSSTFSSPSPWKNISVFDAVLVLGHAAALRVWVLSDATATPQVLPYCDGPFHLRLTFNQIASLRHNGLWFVAIRLENWRQMLGMKWKTTLVFNRTLWSSKTTPAVLPSIWGRIAFKFGVNLENLWQNQNKGHSTVQLSASSQLFTVFTEILHGCRSNYYFFIQKCF